METSTRHICVFIERPAQAVYEFVSAVENLPRWASGLGDTIRVVGEELIAEGVLGKVKVRFAPHNDWGVLDHDVELESGQVVHNPLRVLPCGAGSEIVFSLFRADGVSDEAFEADAAHISKDLETLKAL